MRILLVIGSLLMAYNLCAQKLGSEVIVTDSTGNQVIGILKTITTDKYIIKNNLIGEVKFAIDEVHISKYKNPYSYSTSSKYSFDPPLPSINYLSETGFGLRKGEVYYQNVLLFGQKFGFGLSDNFSINGGFELASPIFDGSAPAVLIAPKFTFNDVRSSIQFGVGANFVFLSNISSTSYVGSIYGIATFGDVNSNVTVGLGWGYDEFEIGDEPVLQLSGFLRLNNQLGLVLDSISTGIFDSFGTGASLMLRMMNRGFLLDVGILTDTSGGYAPMANLAFRF